MFEIRKNTNQLFQLLHTKLWYFVIYFAPVPFITFYFAIKLLEGSIKKVVERRFVATLVPYSRH